MPTTVIKNAAWVVAWDAGAGSHVYRRDVDVAFDDRILFIGRGFAGAAERVVAGEGLCVIPGLVDIHAHPHHEPLYRGIREEHGVPGMYMTGLYERSQALSAPDDEARAASAEFAFAELLQCGVTSLVDISAPWDGWIELFAKSGLRGFLAPGYASARWFMKDDHELHYAWDEKRGRAGFERALAVIDRAAAHPCGRLSGVVSPMQIDTCTEDLLRDSRAAARERGLPFTLHVAQSVVEVREMIRRHGKTPIQWAAELDLLGPGAILGHALFLDTHSWVRWWTRRDLDLLAAGGCAVAHCPTPFARYGQMMENFGDYRRAGVVMGLGTDCSPQPGRRDAQGGGLGAHRGARHQDGIDCRPVPCRHGRRRRRAAARRSRPPRPGHEGGPGFARPCLPADAAGARPAERLRLPRRRPRRARCLRRRRPGGRRRPLHHPRPARRRRPAARRAAAHGSGRPRPRLSRPQRRRDHAAKPATIPLISPSAPPVPKSRTRANSRSPRAPRRGRTSASNFAHMSSQPIGLPGWPLPTGMWRSAPLPSANSSASRASV